MNEYVKVGIAKEKKIMEKYFWKDTIFKFLLLILYLYKSMNKITLCF